MADLIEKIGRFFAEQEAQVQETYSQVAHAAVRAPPPPLSRPAPPVHRIPTHPNAEFGRVSVVTNPAPKQPRSNSLIRRRLSVKSASESITTTQSHSLQESTNQVLDAAQHQSKAREVPSLRSFVPLPPSRHAQDLWSHRLSGDVVSWESASSPASTNSSRDSSTKEEDLVSLTNSDATERQRKPRPPQQKHRKRTRKKKRGVEKRSGNQEEDRPDPKALAKANAEKVTTALMLAQERAKRIQQEKLQLERKQELERQEAAFRLQEQMMRIEAIRAKSFRQLSSSTMTTARSSLSNCESESNNHDTESVWSVDTDDVMESQRPSSPFTTELEAQLREKMSLEMHVKRSCVEKHKRRERVRLKLDKVLQHNDVQSSKVARLTAMKASLAMELAAILEDTAQTRQQRRELEHADEKERLKRQREAERALQVRLREEEWSSMMEDEKTRSQVAAQARVKAGQRVEAHSAKLRRAMQAFLYGPRHPEVSSSARSSNNDSDQSDEERDASSSRHSTEDLVSKPAQPFKGDFYLPPELADFEEDGLCNGDKGTSSTLLGEMPFTWHVPSFPDPVQFTEVLLTMVSDDEDE